MDPGENKTNKKHIIHIRNSGHEATCMSVQLQFDQDLFGKYKIFPQQILVWCVLAVYTVVVVLIGLDRIVTIFLYLHRDIGFIN